MQRVQQTQVLWTTPLENRLWRGEPMHLTARVQERPSGSDAQVIGWDLNIFEAIVERVMGDARGVLKGFEHRLPAFWRAADGPRPAVRPMVAQVLARCLQHAQAPGGRHWLPRVRARVAASSGGALTVYPAVFVDTESRSSTGQAQPGMGVLGIAMPLQPTICSLLRQMLGRTMDINYRMVLKLRAENKQVNAETDNMVAHVGMPHVKALRQLAVLRDSDLNSGMLQPCQHLRDLEDFVANNAGCTLRHVRSNGVQEAVNVADVDGLQQQFEQRLPAAMGTLSGGVQYVLGPAVEKNPARPSNGGGVSNAKVPQ